MQHDSIIAPTADTPERCAFYDKIDKKISLLCGCHWLTS